MPRKKLLYIANLRLPTEKAYGVNIAEMCQAFADRGAEISLVYPYRKNEIKEDIFSYYGVKNNFKIRMLHVPDFYLPGKLDKISVIIKHFISGVFFLFYALRSYADFIYSRDEGTLFLLSFFKKNIYFEAHKFSDARRIFYKRFLARKVRIITISNNLKNEFLKIGFPSGDVLVAHDGVNLEDFDISLSKEEAREKTNLPQNEKIVMYTGHLFNWKGADTLAMAAKLIPDAKFVFVGGTEHDINAFKNKFGNISNILIIGYCMHKEIPIFLKAADVLALPNSSKDKVYIGTSPIKLFEYMASGRPIVASDMSSIREVLNDKNSVLVRSDDIGSLAEGIKKILNSDTLGEELAKKARVDVENYTWIKRAVSIIDFLT